MDKNSVSANQLGILTLFMVLGTSLIYLPALNAGRNGWLAVGLSSIVGFYMIYLLLSLHKSFPGKDLIAISEELLGKYLGKFLSLIFLTSIFFVVTLRLYDLAILMLVIFPLMPYLFVLTVITLIVVYIAFKGLNIVGRLAEVIMWPTVMLLLISYIAALSIHTLDFANVLPIFVYWKPVFSGFLYSANWPFAELVIFGMFLPFVKDDMKQNGRVLYYWLTFAAILLVIRSIITFAVIGAETVELKRFPFLEVYKMIDIPGLERIDQFFFFFWFVTAFFAILLSYQAVAMGTKTLFSLNNYRSILLPLGLLTIIMTFIFHDNDIIFVNLHSPSVIFYILPINLLFPTLLLVMTKIRGPGSKKG
ncbi:hypothetical protein SYNTR_1941 [Candidatus Syntrophocurvum alkaliphilum]|uniref:Spore germination protein GerKB n=1 Tax=Candidatus Syntrophocurvum alkaliphilum TaxID=2293317 RepID=A0A6I6DD27_9FIRM|nr:endospore germination permease [Candidatus Syntrophocurvum alkaliphilum]QGU00535.1 hypothetical protein SYNTR_1941 [Candidatus Syntrophocurvum alkaliphilum]